MATYYASPSGSDAAAGSLEAPWGSLEYAIETGMSTGDTLILRAGTYNAAAGIWKSGTDHTIIANPKNITLQAYTGETVVIDMPSDTASANGLFRFSGAWSVSGIDFTNTTSYAGYMFNMYYAGTNSLSISDSSVDFNNAGAAFVSANNTVVTDANLYLSRCKVKNTNASGAYPIIRTLATKLIVLLEACLFKDTGSITSGETLVSLTMTNCTGDGLKANTYFRSPNASSTFSVYNSILVGNSTGTYPININNTSVSNWTIKNNVVYRPIIADPSEVTGDLILNANGGIAPVDISNYYLDPQFASAATDNYAPLSPWICGRGDATKLPLDGDINGAAWAGADIGCYANANPSLRMPDITPGTIAFIGDSIAEGAGIEAFNSGYLSSLGLSVVASGNLGAAIGGSRVESVKWFVDRAAVTWAPQYVVILSGHNNFGGSGNVSPAGATAQQAADEIGRSIAKARYWGITPIVLGNLASSAATWADQSTRALARNTLYEQQCLTDSVLYDSPLNRMAFNSNFANAYNSTGTEGYYQTGGLAANVHPASVGYRLIVSCVEDLLGSRRGYHVTQSGNSVVASQNGAGTYRYPLSIAGLNSQDGSTSLQALPHGLSGFDVMARGEFSTALNTPAAGSSGKVFRLRGGSWVAGSSLDQEYWRWAYSVVKDTSGTGLMISGANCEVYNLSIYGVDKAISHSADTTVKNTILCGTTAGIETTGGTLTASNNLDYTLDPKFRSTTDFHLRSSSPCINAGTTIEGLTTDFDGRKVPYSTAPDIGAYEYRPTVGPFRW